MSYIFTVYGIKKYKFIKINLRFNSGCLEKTLVNMCYRVFSVIIGRFPNRKQSCIGFDRQWSKHILTLKRDLFFFSKINKVTTLLRKVYQSPISILFNFHCLVINTKNSKDKQLLQVLKQF